LRRQRVILANMRLIEPTPPAERRRTKPAAPPVIAPLDDEPVSDGDDASDPAPPTEATTASPP
jgi:hypothetical protein